MLSRSCKIVQQAANMAANGLLPSSEDWIPAARAGQEFSAICHPQGEKFFNQKKIWTTEDCQFWEIQSIGIPYHSLYMNILCLGKTKDNFVNVSVYLANSVMN